MSHGDDAKFDKPTACKSGIVTGKTRTTDMLLVRDKSREKCGETFPNETQKLNRQTKIVLNLEKWNLNKKIESKWSVRHLCVNKLNPEYLNEMFTTKKCQYNLRDTSILERFKSNTTRYGLKSFRNYGAKIWNLLPNNCNSAVSLDDFKNMIKSWNGPSCKCPVCSMFLN